jgi:CRISPR-associated protein Cas1
MDQNYHIFSDGRIERQQNTLRFVRWNEETEEEEVEYLPVENVEALFLHGQVRFNTKLVSFLNDHGIAMHVFGWKDHYAGSVMPERGQTSGKTLVHQVRVYESERRRAVAAELVDGAIHNMKSNVLYYNRKDYALDDVIDEMERAREQVSDDMVIEDLMGVEARARKAYYRLFNRVLPEDFQMERREYQPPPNEVNSLISFGNSLVYASCVSAIRATALDPSISYLHEPGDRRYSLALDIAELFKPLLADRILCRVVNRKQIKTDDFEEEVGGCLLNESGRKTYTKAFEDTLEQTVEHPDLNRHVSYQYLIRLEAYKIKKHVLTGEPYQSFKRWW